MTGLVKNNNLIAAEEPAEGTQVKLQTFLYSCTDASDPTFTQIKVIGLL